LLAVFTERSIGTSAIATSPAEGLRTNRR
jgi:hypothetical protein